MKRMADLVKGSDQSNPFSDSQARNFSDTKIINEFCPISNYWTLFNDQHEVLLGSRGSGKTFLLKMMRYSMLKCIQDPRAQLLAEQKKFLAVYVPMYLEFVTHLTSSHSSEHKQIQLFQFAFNCLLGQSLLTELNALLAEHEDVIERAKVNFALASDLNDIWFNDNANNISDLFSLEIKLKKVFYNFDTELDSFDIIPPVFKRQIGTSLLAVKEVVARHLNLQEEPTWIICIDEAEFLPECLQRCINSIFRSDSRRIALKVATLPFYHKTLATLEPHISVSAGNDFNYRVVDMKYDSDDFCDLTNVLCAHRIRSRYDGSVSIKTLEDFLGVCGKDDQIDYFRAEVGEEASTHDAIEQGIINEFSPRRKLGAKDYPNPRKTVYDKFAPIYFVRYMYKLSQKGNSIPGWYAGAPMVRKIAQGNPRAFIQIMSNLFEKARKSELTPKAQHKVLFDYAQSFCESTQALEINGPVMYRELDSIAQILQNQVHNGIIKSAGCNFQLSFTDKSSFFCVKDWIQQAIAYSRLFVDEDTLKNGIKKDTIYLLSNTYAARYWLPMRADVSPKRINIRSDLKHTYTVKLRDSLDCSEQQMSMFDED